MTVVICIGIVKDGAGYMKQYTHLTLPTFPDSSPDVIYVILVVKCSVF